MIFAIWQNLGYSTHRLAQACGTALGEPVTHTGTLDPMATGVVVLLSGTDRFVKGSLAWDKTYQFSILWGVATDTGDRLGIITATPTLSLPTSQELYANLSHVLKDFPRTYNQQIPLFSARRIAGSSSFDIARSGSMPPKAVRAVSLSDITMTTLTELTLADLATEVATVCTLTTGDFRQDEILQDWNTKLAAFPPEQTFILTRHEVRTTPGTYIRQLVQDIAERMAVPAVTWSITRTQNGPFGQDDCCTLEELCELSAA